MFCLYVCKKNDQIPPGIAVTLGKFVAVKYDWIVAVTPFAIVTVTLCSAAAVGVVESSLYGVCVTDSLK